MKTEDQDKAAAEKANSFVPVADAPRVGDIVIINGSPAIVSAVTYTEAHPEFTIPARPGVPAQKIPATPASTTISATMFPAGQNPRVVEDVPFLTGDEVPVPGTVPQRLDHGLTARAMGLTEPARARA